MFVTNTGGDLGKCSIPLEGVRCKYWRLVPLLTLKAGTPLMAREISALIFMNVSCLLTVGSSPISSQMVNRRGTVW